MTNDVKLTPALKRRITSDWNSVLPTLSSYKPLWLLRRVGPLVVGIILERDAANESYRPTFHVHNLANPFPGVTLTLAQELRTNRGTSDTPIPAVQHDRKWQEAAGRLAEQAPLPLEGDLRLSQVLQAYRDYVSLREARYVIELHEGMISLCVWCNRCEQASDLLASAYRVVQQWPKYVQDQIEGGIEGWHHNQNVVITCPEAVKVTVQEEIMRHQLEKLPVSQLLCDGE